MFICNIGDLNDEDKVLSWLTSQDVFEIKNEIDEVNKKMLTKLLNENEFVTVFFCKYIAFYYYILRNLYKSMYIV